MLSLRLREITGPLPTSVFDLVDENGTVLGFTQVRHKASASADVPQACASHIYYEIYPDQRNKGYGKEILRLALEEARKIHLHPVIVTCVEDNIASKKIIEAHEGTYTGFCELGDGKKLLRYEFD